MAAHHSMYSRHTLDESSDQQESPYNVPQSPAHRNDRSTTLQLNGLDRQEVPRFGTKGKHWLHLKI